MHGGRRASRLAWEPLRLPQQRLRCHTEVEVTGCSAGVMPPWPRSPVLNGGVPSTALTRQDPGSLPALGQAWSEEPLGRAEVWG